MSKPEALLVAGRRLRNYRDKGLTPPADARITPCIKCGALLALSREAAAQMDRTLADSRLAAAICTLCLLDHVPKIDAVEVSPQGAALLDRNPELLQGSGFRARDVLDELIRRTKK
ncbi:MAG TPA: hypothetical protein VK789_28415 [Bryobacteraceae bacterium]|jgi:hypothetical protein|nr:hypothetical protein [Bryobacteraceae bacterium]